MSRRTQRKYKRRRKTKRRRRRRRRRRRKTRKKYNKRGGAKIPLQIWVMPSLFNNPEKNSLCACPDGKDLQVIYKGRMLATNLQGFELNGCNPYCIFGHVGFSFDDKKLDDPEKKIYGFGPASADFFKNVYNPSLGAITNDTQKFIYYNNRYTTILDKAREAWVEAVTKIPEDKNMTNMAFNRWSQLEKMGADVKAFYISAEVDLTNNPRGHLIKQLWDNGTLLPADLATITPTYIFPKKLATPNIKGGGGGGDDDVIDSKNCITYVVDYLKPYRRNGEAISAEGGQMAGFVRALRT